jgi:hypothetical protein
MFWAGFGNLLMWENEPASNNWQRALPHKQLFPDHFHEHPLVPFSIKFPIKNLLPRSKIQLPFGDRHHHLAPHDLPLHMRISVVLPSAIVLICLGRRIKRSQLLEPFFVILMQAALIIVDKNAGGYMRCLLAI